MVGLFAVEADDLVVGDGIEGGAGELGAVLVPMPFSPTDVTHAHSLGITPCYVAATLRLGRGRGMGLGLGLGLGRGRGRGLGLGLRRGGGLGRGGALGHCLYIMSSEK